MIRSKCSVNVKVGKSAVSMAAWIILLISHNGVFTQKIEMAITGNGNASTEQVAKMLQKLFKIETLQLLDALLMVKACLFAIIHNRVPNLKVKNHIPGWDAYCKLPENPVEVKSSTTPQAIKNGQPGNFTNPFGLFCMFNLCLISNIIHFFNKRN